MSYGSDNDQVVVRPSGALHQDATGAAAAVAAESQVAAQTDKVLLRGVSQLSALIDVTALGDATEMYVKFRFSGDESPDTAVPTDWGFSKVDNVDVATGISSVQDYLVLIDLATVNGVASAVARKYCLKIDLVTALWASVIVWTDGAAGAVGSVSFVRHGGR